VILHYNKTTAFNYAHGTADELNMAGTEPTH